MSRAFAVDLGTYATPSARYRGREGAVFIPEEIADVVGAVLGLDNRPVGRSHIRQAIAPQATTPLTPPAVATLYDFPASLSAAGQTIGILEFGGGYKMSDIKSFFNGSESQHPERDIGGSRWRDEFSGCACGRGSRARHRCRGLGRAGRKYRRLFRAEHRTGLCRLHQFRRPRCEVAAIGAVDQLGRCGIQFHRNRNGCDQRAVVGRVGSGRDGLLHER